MTYKDRYAELKAQHRCVSCKKALPADYTKVRCEHCLEILAQQDAEKAAQEAAKNKPTTE